MRVEGCEDEQDVRVLVGFIGIFRDIKDLLEII